MSATDFKNPEKSGFIMKCGGGVKTWKKRWLVLNNSILYYYKKNTVNHSKIMKNTDKKNKG